MAFGSPNRLPCTAVLVALWHHCRFQNKNFIMKTCLLVAQILLAGCTETQSLAAHEHGILSHISTHLRAQQAHKSTEVQPYRRFLHYFHRLRPSGTLGAQLHDAGRRRRTIHPWPSTRALLSTIVLADSNTEETLHLRPATRRTQQPWRPRSDWKVQPREALMTGLGLHKKI